MNPKIGLVPRQILAGILLVCGAHLNGQTAAAKEAPITPKASQQEETIVLSPFVVDASQDKGYLAANTLSGTRLRTDLKDVAASVSVLNGEFLKDIGAKDMQEAMRYEVNIENQNEFVAKDIEGLANADTTTTRVRGLTGASISRNFFNTSILADTYNVDRFTISRGPNSILFGIGSPSGVIDSTLKVATFRGNVTSVEATFNEHGTKRYLIDHNQKLTDKVAFRFAGMTQDARTFMNPEFDKENRWFFTATVKPFKNTTVTANYEHVQDYRVRARHDTSLKDGISAWIKEGKPMYDNLNGTWLDASGTPVSAATAAHYADLGWQAGSFGPPTRYIFSNGRMVDPSATLPRGNQAMSSPMLVANDPNSVQSLANSNLVPYDLNVFGTANDGHIKAEVGSIFLQQKIAQDLDLEVAYNHEKYTNDSRERIRPAFSAGLQPDVVKYLVKNDGSASTVLNPNAGRYFIEGNQIGWHRDNDEETYRATLSYAFDLTKHSRFLGTHNIAALYQGNNSDIIANKARLMNVLNPATGTGFVGSGTSYYNLRNEVLSRAYLDLPGSGAGTSTAGNWTSPQSAVKFDWPTVDGSVWEQPSRYESKNTAMMAVLQSRFNLLPENKDELIVTLGVRSDKQDKYSYPYSSLPRNPKTGEYLWEAVARPSAPSFTESGKTTTAGVVYKTPITGLSFMGNISDNFSPQGNWQDITGKPRTANKGKSTDFGISYEAMKGKLYVKLVHFDATAKNEVQQDWYYWGPYWMAFYEMEDQVAGWHNVYAARGDHSHDKDVPGGINLNSFDNNRPVLDRHSTGNELELVAQPTPNLNIRLTMAYTKAVDSQISSDMFSYMDKRLPVFKDYFYKVAYWYAGNTTPANPDDDYAWKFQGLPASPARPDTLWSSAVQGWGDGPSMGGPNAWSRVEELRRLQGKKVERLAAWRANLVANYNFSEGSFKGFSVGGGLRYRSPEAIGYHGAAVTVDYMATPLIIGDNARPIYGANQLGTDLWAGYEKKFKLGAKTLTWNIKVFVYNAFSNGGFEPGGVAPTLTGPIVYTNYLIREPRTASITNTITF